MALSIPAYLIINPPILGQPELDRYLLEDYCFLASTECPKGIEKSAHWSMSFDTTEGLLWCIGFSRFKFPTPDRTKRHLY